MNAEERDISRLSKKWQTYIEDREREIRELKAHIKHLSVPPPNSRVFIRHYEHPDQAVADGSMPLEFRLGDDTNDPHVREHIAVRIERSRVRVDGVVQDGSRYLYVSGGESIRIAPHASNAVYIYLNDD